MYIWHVQGINIRKNYLNLGYRITDSKKLSRSHVSQSGSDVPTRGKKVIPLKCLFKLLEQLRIATKILQKNPELLCTLL